MNRDNDPDRPPTDQHVVVERQGPADMQGVVEVVHPAIAMVGDDADRVIEIRRAGLTIYCFSLSPAFC